MGENIRIYCWNVRGAGPTSLAWDMLRESSPDLALLQEVGGLPADVAANYQAVTGIPVSKHGKPQRFRTMILVRGTVENRVHLASRWDWVNRELDHFKGNLVACHATIRGVPYRVMSVYSPAWPVDPARLEGTDVEPVKLKLNPKVWVTELLHAALLESDPNQPPWIVGGDLNSSVSFDLLWRGGPRGNQEIQDRMQNLGLTECLRAWNGELVPTFRNPRGGKVIHQMDHVFVSNTLAAQLISCTVGEGTRVFGASLSDHLPITADFRPIPRIE